MVQELHGRGGSRTTVDGRRTTLASFRAGQEQHRPTAVDDRPTERLGVLIMIATVCQVITNIIIAIININIILGIFESFISLRF